MACQFIVSVTSSASFHTTQGKKLKPEQEADEEEGGDVTDEDEADEMDSSEAAASFEKTDAGEGPSTSSPPPAKDKKPKKVRVHGIHLMQIWPLVVVVK